MKVGQASQPIAQAAVFVTHGCGKGGKDTNRGKSGKDGKKGSRTAKGKRSDSASNRDEDNEVKPPSELKKSYRPCLICSERGHPAYKCPELKHCREYVSERKSGGETASVGVDKKCTAVAFSKDTAMNENETDEQSPADQRDRAPYHSG